LKNKLHHVCLLGNAFQQTKNEKNRNFERDRLMLEISGPSLLRPFFLKRHFIFKYISNLNFPLTFVRRQQWKLLKADLKPFFLKRHFIFKYNSKF
jgi:hypothetical protein